jgi:hypothetical protein
MRATAPCNVKVADEVWIATALLHREHPDSVDFTIDEIMERVRQENLTESLRPGVYAHVAQHCVANRPPNSGRYRMLYETAPGRRRLFRTGDLYDPAREGAKTVPSAETLPEPQRALLDWYRQWDSSATGRKMEEDPILALVGSGKHLWDEHPDDYVRSLREGWE